ncbi:MAG TPA: class I SAM-dependent methyltransferase [Bryobacteraceae bacterium]|nr:class I SAM-dependent methyltransferase [Bryobacteraceae bacterium]
MNLWSSNEHALDYLSKAGEIPHRTEGEAVLLDLVPKEARRILDIGCGDGRLLALLKVDRPSAEGIGLDFSAAMLEAAKARFAGDATVKIVEHNLEYRLPSLGYFDAIVSSFAIHHVEDDRKRGIYSEAYRALPPGGIFLNLEHVASSTRSLHDAFLRRLNVTRETEDPSNKLTDMKMQLSWLREIGFTDVDCHWKWFELALLAGVKPG